MPFVEMSYFNYMNEFYLPNIFYNNRKDTQKLCLAYTKDTHMKI